MKPRSSGSAHPATDLALQAPVAASRRHTKRFREDLSHITLLQRQTPPAKKKVETGTHEHKTGTHSRGTQRAHLQHRMGAPLDNTPKQQRRVKPTALSRSPRDARSRSHRQGDHHYRLRGEEDAGHRGLRSRQKTKKKDRSNMQIIRGVKAWKRVPSVDGRRRVELVSTASFQGRRQRGVAFRNDRPTTQGRRRGWRTWRKERIMYVCSTMRIACRR